MTAKEAFRAAFKRVCKAKLKADDLEFSAECWRQVQHVPVELFDAIADKLIAECEWFPDATQWRLKASEVVADAKRRATEGAGKLPPMTPEERAASEAAAREFWPKVHEVLRRRRMPDARVEEQR